MESTGIHGNSNLETETSQNHQGPSTQSSSSGGSSQEKPIRYVIIPISFVNSGKQHIKNALVKIIPHTIVIDGHGMKNEKFFGKLSHAFDNDNVKVLIVHKNNTTIQERSNIYKSLKSFKLKYDLRFIAIQYVQKYELFSPNFMNRLLNDIIINEEINHEDLSVLGKGPARVREIVDSTRRRFQDLSAADKKFCSLVISLSYKDNKFFEYLKTVIYEIHESFVELIPNILTDEEIAKHTYEADLQEDCKARDFYSHGQANLEKYELHSNGEFSESSEPRGLNTKPSKIIIIQCSTLGTGKEKITKVLNNNLIRSTLVESSNQATLFKDLSRAFIKHKTIIINANNHKYFHRSMILQVLKRFQVNYQIHAICLDYINDTEHTTFDFFQKSINYLLSWDFDAFAKKLQPLTLTKTEARATPKLIQEFDKLTPKEIKNYEVYIPLTYDHRRIYEYLIQIHKSLTSAFEDELFQERFRLEDCEKIAHRADLREHVCWKYYHESIGYNETTFLPNRHIPYRPERRKDNKNRSDKRQTLGEDRKHKGSDLDLDPNSSSSSSSSSSSLTNNKRARRKRLQNYHSINSITQSIEVPVSRFNTKKAYVMLLGTVVLGLVWYLLLNFNESK